MEAQYQHELAMSEIKGYTKITLEGRAFKGKHGAAYWVRSLFPSKDTFIPISQVKGFEKFENEGTLPTWIMWIPDWFLNKNEVLKQYTDEK